MSYLCYVTCVQTTVIMFLPNKVVISRLYALCRWDSRFPTLPLMPPGPNIHFESLAPPHNCFNICNIVASSNGCLRENYSM